MRKIKKYLTAHYGGNWHYVNLEFGSFWIQEEGLIASYHTPTKELSEAVNVVGLSIHGLSEIYLYRLWGRPEKKINDTKNLQKKVPIYTTDGKFIKYLGD